MSAKQKQEPQAVKAAKPKLKLTNAEKREIRRIIEKAQGDGKAHSAQDTLPFRQMYPDGLCRLDEKTWSRCIEFEDVNYQLAKPDDQTAIFEALCDMYNAHDASIGILPSLHLQKSKKVRRYGFRNGEITSCIGFSGGRLYGFPLRRCFSFVNGIKGENQHFSNTKRERSFSVCPRVALPFFFYNNSCIKVALKASLIILLICLALSNLSTKAKILSLI